MPSHLQEDKPLDIPDLVTLTDIRGNNFADIAAGRAATKHQVPLNTASKVLYYYRLVKKIQNRLVEIVCASPSRPKVVKTQKVIIPPEPLESLIDKSQHVVVFQKRMIVCTRCCQSHPRTYKSASLWLATSCSAIGTCSDRPTHLPLSVRQLGNNIAHHSNSLFIFRGLHFCSKCGGTGAFKFHKLANRCIPVTDKLSRGAVTIDRISRGLLPNMMSEWPDERLQNLKRSEFKTLSDFQHELTATEHIINITQQLQDQNQPITVPSPPGRLGQFCVTDDSDVEQHQVAPLTQTPGAFDLIADQLIVEPQVQPNQHDSSDGGESD